MDNLFCISDRSRMKRQRDQLDELIDVMLFDDEEENYWNEFVQIVSLPKRKKTHEMIKNRETEGAYKLLITKI